MTRCLSLAEYLYLAEQVTGTAAPVLTRAELVDLADSALHAPQAGFGDEDFFTDLHDKAAVLACRLAWNHPLPDGNKRAAWAALVMFIELNDGRWVPDPPVVHDAETAILAVAAHEVDESWFAVRLRERVHFECLCRLRSRRRRLPMHGTRSSVHAAATMVLIEETGMTHGNRNPLPLVSPRLRRTARTSFTWRRVGALVAVVGIFGAGCGRSGGTDATGDSAPTSASAAEMPTSGPGAGEFGDLGSICGPAPSGTTLTASDAGVTATSIQIGTVADPGFSGRPGVNQEFFDNAEAFSKWCNQAGGINGRKIVVKERDAKLTEHQSRMIEACDEGDFMLVGGGGIFDEQGQKERLACGLPAIAGMLVTPTAVESDLAIVPMANDMSTLPIGDLHWLEKQFPEATQKIGFLTGGIAVTITAANRNKEAMKSLGWKVVYDEEFNAAGETSWRGFVEGMKAAGVRGVIWTADPSALAAVLKAMDEIEYHPDFVRAGSNIYDNLLLSEAGKSANGTYIMTSVYPFLDPKLAKQNPATKQYLDIMSEYDPGGKIANLGVTGFSGWLLFAKSAKACGADLTRDCVWENATAITDWTGGGLHSRQDLTTGQASQCFVEIEAKDGGWLLPDIGANEGLYNCDPGNVFDSNVDYGQGVKCENPAFADDPKPSSCAL